MKQGVLKERMTRISYKENNFPCSFIHSYNFLKGALFPDAVHL